MYSVNLPESSGSPPAAATKRRPTKPSASRARPVGSGTAAPPPSPLPLPRLADYQNWLARQCNPQPGHLSCAEYIILRIDVCVAIKIARGAGRAYIQNNLAVGTRSVVDCVPGVTVSNAPVSDPVYVAITQLGPVPAPVTSSKSTADRSILPPTAS